MKKFKYLFGGVCSVLFVASAANAAVYNDGGYRSPQYRYNSTGVSPSANGAYASTRYQPSGNGSVNYKGNTYQQPGTVKAASQPKQSSSSSSASNTETKGFFLNGTMGYETANWDFSMKTAGSHLHYDNISWMVFDLGGGYAFGDSAAGLRIDAGVRFGMQTGDSKMVDDDISKGGYYQGSFQTNTGNTYDIYGNALSIGKSSGGSQFGYNIALGLADKIQLGNIKMTPSIGYRSLKYSLTTKDNYGMAVDTSFCVQVPGSDELQCDPLVVIQNGTNAEVVGNGGSTSGGTLDTGGTYYWHQPGKSHKYETTWAGPYVALDLDYHINDYNVVKFRGELGLPAYTSTGDQPYRYDWEHPKSVEDSAGIGDAYHFGMLASYSTAITDSVFLDFGLTYDYYTVSGAKAKTYLSDKSWGVSKYGWPDGTPWETVLSDIVNNNFGGDLNAALAGSELAYDIYDLMTNCPGWVCTMPNEIKSFYKSLGFRVGISGKF